MIRSWWTQSNHAKLLASQTKLFDTFLPHRTVQSVKVAGVNAVSIDSGEDREDSTSKPVCVLAHGFGSGLGFFYQNVDPILNSGKYSRLILVDWLGMGGSDRPSCRASPYRSVLQSSWCDANFSPEQATQFFVDPLRRFLDDQVPSSRIHLVGHSLGGYLAGCYALAYPDDDRIEKLVLASPVGFPEKPANALPSAQMPTSLRLMDTLWSSNITPQALIRGQGATRGRRTVERVLQARIGSNFSSNPRHLEALADYLYHITVAPPSGEFAMNSLLSPAASPDIMGVFAREPLERRMLEQSLNKNLTLRVSFGDHDWMRPNEPSARRVVDQLNDKGEIRDGRVDVVSGAGHHLYLENVASFTRSILD